MREELRKRVDWYRKRLSTSTDTDAIIDALCAEVELLEGEANNSFDVVTELRFFKAQLEAEVATANRRIEELDGAQEAAQKYLFALERSREDANALQDCLDAVEGALRGLECASRQHHRESMVCVTPEDVFGALQAAKSALGERL